MDLRQIAADIPEYPVFLTVDELNASSHRLVEQYPDLVTIEVVGQTRRGDPIELVTISGGEQSAGQQAFVFGGPHPNEPIGTMTIEYLTRRLCEDANLRGELGYTWHFIKCIDSDGMRLNEGWFKGPFTPTNYARNFFRPAPFDQVEWTFPLQYKNADFNSPMPETRALMRVIDRVQPKFLYSLHNAGFGGVYYYVSRECQPLYSVFHEIPSWFNLALDLGEPEVSYATTFAPAIYGMLKSTDTYDYLEKNGVADPASVLRSGASSAEYAAKYGSFFLVVEMPYFDDPRVNDLSPSNTRRRDAILQNLNDQDAFDAWIDGELAAVQPHLLHETLISRAVTAFLSMGKTYREAERQWAMTAPETERPATNAELFSSLLGSKFYRLLLLGMFGRMLAHERTSGNTRDEIAGGEERAVQRLNEQGSALESQLQYRALPIRSLVGVQTCAGLATAEYLQRDSR
jgi:hypothetical protein